MMVFTMSCEGGGHGESILSKSRKGEGSGVVAVQMTRLYSDAKDKARFIVSQNRERISLQMYKSKPPSFQVSELFQVSKKTLFLPKRIIPKKSAK